MSSSGTARARLRKYREFPYRCQPALAGPTNRGICCGHQLRVPPSWHRSNRAVRCDFSALEDVLQRGLLLMRAGGKSVYCTLHYTIRSPAMSLTN